jgi:hypothetical protein
MDDGQDFEFEAKVWLWRASKPGAGWHFVTVEGQIAAEIRYAALGRTRGFGSIRVDVTIGGTRWQTSLFPSGDDGGFVLPLKADVRKRETIAEGDVVRGLIRV